RNGKNTHNCHSGKKLHHDPHGYGALPRPAHIFPAGQRLAEVAAGARRVMPRRKVFRGRAWESYCFPMLETVILVLPEALSGAMLMVVSPPVPPTCRTAFPPLWVTIALFPSLPL